MPRGQPVARPQDNPALVADLFRDFSRIKEKVEKLTGDRGDAKRPLSAIRRAELLPLSSLSLQSAQVTAAPTQADFNALQTDVANIFAALQKISNILGQAEIPPV